MTDGCSRTRSMDEERGDAGLVLEHGEGSFFASTGMAGVGVASSNMEAAMLMLRPGLWALESSSSWGCRTYLLADAGRVFLVDLGPSFQLNPVARELRASGRSPYEVTDILLTHHDWDHAHSAAEWRRRTGATVWLGAADAEMLRTGTVPGTRLRRFACWLFRLSELPEGTVELSGEVTVTAGLTALPTPGYTPGHYAFV